jgi:hypothetical protein
VKRKVARPEIAVIGGGILGVTAALLAAERDWRVRLFEAEPALWSKASAAGEGKVHLGPIFVLGDEATRRLMLEGALNFAAVLERAAGTPLPWNELATESFEYLVMPDSLLDPDELSSRYRALNDLISPHPQMSYLGERLSRIVDPVKKRDARSGLPCFRTHERSVEPNALGLLLTGRLRAAPEIRVSTGIRIDQVIDRKTGGADLVWRDPNGHPNREGFDAVVNSAWDQQQVLLPERARRRYNFRVKCAVRLPRTAAPPTNVTLVQGPYGDIVTHRDYIYASWYPAARLTNEYGATPSEHARKLLRELPGRTDLIAAQLGPLRALGLLPAGLLEAAAARGQLVGGVIVGHGEIDIHLLSSSLHSRAEFGPERHGAMVVARNFKLTTAPLAAQLAIEEIARGLGR